MTLKPLCLRVETPGGHAIEEYRIQDNDVQVRRMQGPSQHDCDWRQLTAEELTNHVYRNSTVAQWLERRLGWRQLLRACSGEELYHTENAEHTGLRHVA